MKAAEHDVLAYISFPSTHRVKLHATNTLERLNKEVKRRADDGQNVLVLPAAASILRTRMA